MKTLISVVFLVLLVSIGAFAQCPDEPILASSEILATKQIEFSRPVEVSLTLLASSFQTSWKAKGSEAAAVSIFVDGKYDQDVLLFSGILDAFKDNSKSFPYEIFIGELGKGEHKIDVALNRKRSAAKIGNVAITDMQIGATSLQDFLTTPEDGPQNPGRKINLQRRRAQFLAVANAPFIYARPNAIDKFTDIPLIMYYEIFNDPGDITRIRYTVIFTNEDGGTQSKALMARWGRMTDIEWIYEMTLNKKGSVISETYQAANHQTLPFKGKRVFGSHPLMYTVTDNNNFSDTGCSALRFAPEPEEADLSGGSRETIMEKFPWTYRIMAEEMLREGRVAAGSREPNIVDDPREYVYAEIYNEPQSAAVSLEIQTTDGRKFDSDLGSSLLRIDRPGYFRIAVHVPSDVSETSINKFSIGCFATQPDSNGNCKNLRLIKIVKLMEDYRPVERVVNSSPQSIKTGESAAFTREALSVSRP